MVSNKKYNEVLGKINELNKKIDFLETQYDGLCYEYKNECQLYYESCEKRVELIKKLDVYKQKYLDEQQKRLELAELVEKLEGALNESV